MFQSERKLPATIQERALSMLTSSMDMKQEPQGNEAAVLAGALPPVRWSFHGMLQQIQSVLFGPPSCATLEETVNQQLGMDIGHMGICVEDLPVDKLFSDKGSIFVRWKNFSQWARMADLQRMIHDAKQGHARPNEALRLVHNHDAQVAQQSLLLVDQMRVLLDQHMLKVADNAPARLTPEMFNDAIQAQGFAICQGCAKVVAAVNAGQMCDKCSHLSHGVPCGCTQSF